MGIIGDTKEKWFRLLGLANCEKVDKLGEKWAI